MLPRNRFLFLFCITTCATICWGNAPNSKVEIDSRFVGTWHSIQIRCADDSYHPYSSSVLSAQLIIEKTGQFSWSHFVDLNEPSTCSDRFTFEQPNVLKSAECDLEPYWGPYKYDFSQGVLTLRGSNGNEPDDEFTIRLARGALPLKWSEPAPCVCDEAPVPNWTLSAKPIMSKLDLSRLDSNSVDAKRLRSNSNRLLWEAVQAFEGRAGSIALKRVSTTIEGDTVERYLLASSGRAVVITHTDEGMIEHLSTCRCPVAIMKLKVKSSGPARFWRFATHPPQASDEAYIEYPGEQSDTRSFPDL